MKRFLALTAIVALLAPAIAVCAGTTTGMRGAHDCCPPEDRPAMATSPTFAEASCCDRSADAAQRNAVLVAGVTPSDFGAPAALPLVTIAPVALDAPGQPAAHRLGLPADSPPDLSPPLSLRI